jgi:hypothetical protein
MAAGFNSSINSKPAAGRYKLPQKFRLSKWLSAGKCHSTAGLTIKNSIPFNYRKDVVNCHD